MIIDSIIKFLLITLLILQIGVLIHMLISQIRRDKEDKKFWEQISDAVKTQVDKYNNLYPDESLKLEEDNDDENRQRNKK